MSHPGDSYILICFSEYRVFLISIKTPVAAADLYAINILCLKGDNINHPEKSVFAIHGGTGASYDFQPFYVSYRKIIKVVKGIAMQRIIYHVSVNHYPYFIAAFEPPNDRNNVPGVCLFEDFEPWYRS